ncbi:hypothetical protein B0H19DRAFT_1033360 [Mycena capillaripes]|nr:hypothetical protein B0H19DRAFT_1033360 [Mycena capillaripes]
MDGPSPSSSTSLTPQRKHRKLLKDGSGTAVWPEAIEALFVQGLREYWDSPWATYSRGRSRWRNQFLVDYLQNLGITRSKKQVASHIQVLRNMWKGEPEYHLVAGGEELFQDPVKLETPEHPSALLTIDDAYDDDGSSLSNSPAEFLQEFPSSPAPGLSYSPSSPLSSLPDIPSPPVAFSHLAGPYSYPPHQKAYQGPPAAFAQAPVRYPNRISGLTLLAEGMTALTINLDKLSRPPSIPARTHPLALRLRLAIPSVDETRAPVNLHGFFGNVRLASLWSSQAKVCTRVFDASGRCFSTEEESLQAISVELGTVVAALPDSSLSRARWLDPTAQVIITQDIMVDGATLLSVVYELDRRPSPNALPSAELLNFQKHTGSADPKPPSSPTYASYAESPPNAYTYPHPTASPAIAYSPSGYYAVADVYTHPQAHAYGHPPPSSTYTPSLSAALTPVPLRS